MVNVNELNGCCFEIRSYSYAASYVRMVYLKKLTFCDCNYEFATIITPLLQIYVSSDYGA